MLFLTYEATPLPSNPKSSECGGAFVNCWINQTDEEIADKQARKGIYKGGWLAQRLVEIKKADQHFSEENEEIGQFIQQAREEGECYVFYTWPINESPSGWIQARCPLVDPIYILTLPPSFRSCA